jgi:hypothetical protein
MHPDGYFALILDEASRNLVRREYATLKHEIAHHCTVRYGTNRLSDLPAPFVPADLGRIFQLRVIGVARLEGKLEAVAVALVLSEGRLLEAGFSENPIPHVTVATDGVEEPARANDLLADGFMRIEGPLLDARLEHTRTSTKKIQI